MKQLCEYFLYYFFKFKYKFQFKANKSYLLRQLPVYYANVLNQNYYIRVSVTTMEFYVVVMKRLI